MLVMSIRAQGFITNSTNIFEMIKELSLADISENFE